MRQDDRDATANDLSGTVHGHAVQAGSIHGGVHFHLPAAEASPEHVPAPESWSDVGELPVEVRFLLKAEVQAAQELPYRLPGARRPSLATVYVRQDLGGGAEDPAVEQARPAPIVDARGQLVDPPTRPAVRVVVRSPSRTVRDALDVDDYVLVTGGPGQGKSTLSLRLAADVASRWLAQDAGAEPLAEPVVPLRLTARELAGRLDLPFPDALAASALVEYGASLGRRLDARVLAERVAGCRWLLLVDGLDEVANGVERDRLVTVLATWAADPGSPYRFVLTTRPIEGASLAPLQRIGAARYELQPFDEKALRHFADNWFGDADHGYRFVRQIRAAHLHELVRVPLLATIAAIIFEQHGDRPLPDNQYELYESYLKYLRSAHQTRSSRFDPVRDSLLEHLGWMRLRSDPSLVAAAREWAESHLANLTGDWHEELVTYLTAVGPLTRRGEDIRFLHHSFAEHLAATAEARLLPERFEPEHHEFARLLHGARPKEGGRHARAVLLHHTRLHEAEADRLVGWLHTGGAEQHLLAARLLAWHVPAGAEVVDEFLKTVRAWGMTTQYPGHDILSQASRAAHHPGIAEWLRRLMEDEEAPWPSRVEAATALATRLHGPGADDATALLRAIALGEQEVPVSQRLDAAEALSECGGGERKSSEHGLRSVLADPAATAYTRRTAAVVLATFDGAARKHAADALIALLDDPWTPGRDLVEAATGLVEIGVEFHDRCAEVFRTFLATSRNNLEDAAIGLASLGPRHLVDAVSALTRLITDRRVARNARVRTCDALGQLGPQHRVSAGEHLRAIAAEPGVDPGDRWTIAQSLARNGLPGDAVELFRAVLADRMASTNNHLWAARGLADIGPEYRDEATQALRRVIDHPKAGAYDRAAAFAQLADLGERTAAVASLRGVLADQGASPSMRRDAADELIRLGPEFHDEVAERLLDLAARQLDPEGQLMAWTRLRDLGSRNRERASAAIHALLVRGGRDGRRSLRGIWMPNINHEPELLSLVVGIVDDVSYSGEARLEAALILVQCGRPHHPTAVEGVLGLLRSGEFPVSAFRGWTLRELGAAPREAIAGVLRELACDPERTARDVCDLAEVLDDMDQDLGPEVLAAVRGVVVDPTVDPDIRGEAAVTLAGAVPGELPDVLPVILRSDGRSVVPWMSQVLAAALLGADVVPGLRALVAGRDVGRQVREKAAMVLGELSQEHRDEAVAELRAQAGDEFLEFTWRTDAIVGLGKLEPETLDHAVAFHRTVLDDERQPVECRTEAAYRLVELEPSLGEVALAALRRFATSPEFSPAERESALSWFAVTAPLREHEIERLGLALARDPAASTEVRSRVRVRLGWRAHHEVERSLLTDRTAAPDERVGGLNTWQDGERAAEAEAVLRELLTAPDTTPRERIEAAAALARLSPRHVPEVAEVLESLSDAVEARDALGALGRGWSRRVLAEADRVLADETCSWRRRAEAAVDLWDGSADPPDTVADHLRQLVGDTRVADADRVSFLYSMGRLDGLDRLRELRDDVSARPVTRRSAAILLRWEATADRAAGARVLAEIAADSRCRPALRWRAAHDLTRFGERGRERGVAELRAISADESMPVIVRGDALRALGTVRPDLRAEILQSLHDLRSAAHKPLALLQVHRAIGEFDPATATRALHELARDGQRAPGVRLRAARLMAELRADHRERAAIVAREVMHDVAVPWHIRVKAARLLARWSELCRDEAIAVESRLP